MATALPMVAPLNAFPFCSPQGPLQAHCAKSGKPLPLFFTPLSASKLANFVAEREELATTLPVVAPLNAFPSCSPQGPLQAHCAKSGKPLPLFFTPLSASKLATRYKKQKVSRNRYLFCYVVLRRGRDSNPRSLAAQRFSRPPQSTTLPPLRAQKYNKNFNPPNNL